MKNIDWYDKLKLDIIALTDTFRLLKETVVFMLQSNSWILEDIKLCESFLHLQEMVEVSNNDLDEFVQRIYLLDSSSYDFSKEDLMDEFDYIRENIHLESGYITNMVNYMVIVDDPLLHEMDKINKLEEYQDIDVSCYNQMKINNEGLKRLRKERRDNFE